jgi:hypothetical protein
VARTLTAGMQTAIAQSTIRPIYFAELEFESQTIRLTSATRDITWDSETWLGNGWLKPLNAIDESAQLRATGCQVILSGLPSSLIAVVLGQSIISKKGTIWLGLLDSSMAIITDPYLIFKGYLDVPEIDDSHEDGTVALNYESDLISLDRPVEYRYSDQAHQALFAGDLGFQYTPQMEDWNGFWGKAERVKWKKRRRPK